MDDADDLWDPPAASLKAPDIPGLHFNPVLLIDEAYAAELVQHVLPFFAGGANQVMLFGKGDTLLSTNDSSNDPSGLPPFISHLISRLSGLLHDQIPHATHTLLFPQTPEEHKYPARQVILNLYRPGEGITPHVDLLKRFGDGIVGLSLLSDTVMTFTHSPSSEVLAPAYTPASESSVAECGSRSPMQHQLWLPARSVLVMERDARYNWAHGIPARTEDFVHIGGGDASEKVWKDRHTRISITIRWLLPGAEIVGGDAEAAASTFS